MKRKVTNFKSSIPHLCGHVKKEKKNIYILIINLEVSLMSFQKLGEF
jgi:hypothetical protein